MQSAIVVTCLIIIAQTSTQVQTSAVVSGRAFSNNCIVEFYEELPINSKLDKNILQCVNIQPTTFRGSIQGQQLINSGEQYLNNEYLTFSHTGTISIAQPIDRDHLCSINQPVCHLKFSVIVYDSERDETRPIIMHLRIKDRNDKIPRFEVLNKTVHLVENAEPSTPIPLPAAQDDDALEKLTYSLTPLSSCFALHNARELASGVQPQLTLQKALDYEKISLYEFKLTACDSDNQCGVPLSLKIKVQDQNDNAPAFFKPRQNSAQFISDNVGSYGNEEDSVLFEKLISGDCKYVIKVRENETGLILRLSIRDVDSGMNSKVNLSLDNPSQFIKMHFLLRTMSSIKGLTQGELVLRRPLNSKLNNFPYKLKIRATDFGTPPLESVANVYIIVLDINNHKPEIFWKTFFEKKRFELVENIPNRKVALISVRDRDFGENARVHCHLGRSYESADFSLNNISPVLFELTNDKIYDCEEVVMVRVQIHCRDFGAPMLNSTLLLSLPIADENEFAPVFAKKIFIANIDEDGQLYLSRYVLRVEASDKDRSSQLHYEILHHEENYFRIVANTGAIYTSRLIDREQLQSSIVNNVVHFDVRVTDGQFNNVANVRITINDVNDNAPMFTNPLPFRVKEDAPIGTEIGQILAHDNDQHNQVASKISFCSIKNSFVIYNEIDEPFKILSDGRVVLLKKLDRETTKDYLVHLKAVDGISGSIRHTTTGSITIIVEDVNDNAPYFRRPDRQDISIVIYNSLPVSSSVYKAEARDADEISRQKIVFQFFPTNNEYFRINKTTGEITIGKKLIPSRLLIVLRVSDGLFHTDCRLYFNITADISSNNNIYLQRAAEVSFNFSFLVTIVAVTTGISVLLVVAIVLVRRREGCCNVLTSQLRCHENESHQSPKKHDLEVAAEERLFNHTFESLSSFGQPTPSTYSAQKKTSVGHCGSRHLYDSEVLSTDSGHDESEESFLPYKGRSDSCLQTLSRSLSSRDLLNCACSSHPYVQPPGYQTLNYIHMQTMCNCDLSTSEETDLQVNYLHNICNSCIQLKSPTVPLCRRNSNSKDGTRSSILKTQYFIQKLDPVLDINSPSPSISHRSTPQHCASSIVE